MFHFPIGVVVESFRKEIHEAIKEASALGLDGIQMYATRGEFAPEAFTPERRRELLRFAKDNGVRFSAICGDFGHGFMSAESNKIYVERSKRVVDLALEMETDIVTTHIGVVPEDKNHERYQIMQEACASLAEYADSMNAHFAVETGPETSAVLGDFLDSLGSCGVGVNLDPANLVMVTGDDPVKAVHRLKKYIVHTHAKDGVMLRRTNPEYIYSVIPMPEDMERIDAFREVALGEGSVDFAAYLKALEEIGYRGFLTIEREAGETPAKDISIAADYLRKIMKEN
ncbi:MAG: sugar phosphate isomerase/epimerase [Clostridia bacterium]|nr:sugar phosphate isomerase/epimerase [Clostridia bacterium]MBQ9804919.1 sugar phosphate isomerase/epimerase [Clostridia bacterium]